MSNQNLLASAALFRALYDNNKDIYDVISEFIRGYIVFNSKWSFNATECVSGLKETFDLDLPEAVVSTCLRKRLKKRGELSLYNGTYSVTDSLNRESFRIEDFQNSKSDYHQILQKLTEHIRGLDSPRIDLSKIEDSFRKYLLNEKLPNDHSSHIAQFLISNQNDLEFKRKVNLIEEGLILYAGIKYSSDLSSLGSWRGNLVVFLDTEHLFSAAGLHGNLYKKIFDEFYSLVREVNGKPAKTGRISLRILEETNDEVHNFFHAAESIIEQKRGIDPSKTAMIEITNGCKWRSDVVEKKKNFERDIARLGIQLETKQNYYQNPEYNIESEEVLLKLSEEFGSENGDKRIADILKIFTKMNVIRRGESNVPIDFVASLFLTESGHTKAVAFSETIRPDHSSIPFATDIEFLTERLWFKLNKGFGGDSAVPTSFDVITKAKLVLSSQLNRSISDSYKDLSGKYERGEMDKESAAIQVAELRSRPNRPDDMTETEAERSIEFIDCNLVDRAQRERSFLMQRAQDGEKATAELKRIRHLQHKESLRPIKRRIRFSYYSIITLISIALGAFVYFLIKALVGENDSILSITFGLLSVIIGIFSLSRINYIRHRCWSLCVRKYRNLVELELQRSRTKSAF